MENIVKFSGIVTGFYVGEQHIDCMCGKELVKIDKHSGEVILKKTVFEKEGLSRNLSADRGRLFIYDFCTLYAFDQKDYELIGKWKLGKDLSSDICGLAVDQDTIYCSIRNGKIITLDRQSYAAREFSVSGSSMWSIKRHDKYLVCGTVDGKLLLLDKTALSAEKALALGKKNIGSLYIDGEILYAASHDGTLFKIDLRAFEIVSSAKKAHRKMFHCAGLHEDTVVTVSYPCSEIALWDKNSLERRRVIDIPLRLSGHAHIENGLLYISSRNILGIDVIRLNEH